MAVHPEVLQVFWGLYVAIALNISPMLWFAWRPEGVLRGAGANAYSALAELLRARAPQNCGQPPIPSFIAPLLNPRPPQTYVLAALYELPDAKGDRRTIERMLNARAHGQRAFS